MLNSMETFCGERRRPLDGAWHDCRGLRRQMTLKGSLKGCVTRPLCASSLDVNLKDSFMILSHKKLPELWDYFLIYVSGALEFNPDSRVVDLGLFPLRMNPTIKTR